MESRIEISGRDSYCGRKQDIVKTRKVPDGFAVTLSRPLMWTEKENSLVAPHCVGGMGYTYHAILILDSEEGSSLSRLV